MTEKKKKKAILNLSTDTMRVPRKMRRQCRKTLPFKESDKKRIRIN